MLSQIQSRLHHNIWLFHETTEPASISIAFYNNNICGWTHPDYVFYKITSDALIIFDKNKKASVHFPFENFNETAWIGQNLVNNCHSTSMLSINQHHPATIPWNRKFLNIAKKHKFYFAHFKQLHKLYTSNSILTAYPKANIEAGATLGQYGIYPIGMFSYVAGQNSNNMHTVRYRNIAVIFLIFGNAHPTQWVSTSLVFYTNHHQALYNEVTGHPLNPGLFFEERQNLIPITIGHDVWIGEGCLFKPGITIRNNAIIGARSIVTKDVPSYAIVAGSPASVRKLRFNPKIIKQLLDLQWWDYFPHQLHIQ